MKRPLLTLVAALSCLACGPQPADLTLRVRFDDAVAVDPAALKIIVHTATDLTPRVIDPVALDALDSVDLLVEVGFEEDFYLDVWGCRSLAQCGEDGRIARGCSDIQRVSPGEAATVEVTLLEDGAGTAACDAVEL